MIRTLNLQNSIYYIVIVLLCLVITSNLYLIYAYPSLGPDSGFYLKTSYDLANGLEFYNNFNNSYTPMSMYINSLIFYFSDSISLPIVFSYFLLIYLFLAVLFYKITFFISTKKKINLISTLLFISLLLILEGIHVLLEPYVLLFQFLAIYTLLKYKNKSKKYFLFVGVFVFLSFFSKQYGLFVLPAILYLIFKFSNKLTEFLKSSLYLFLGLFVLLLFFIVFYCFYKDAQIKEFLYQLLGIPALSGDELITNIGYSLNGLKNSIKRILKVFPFIILLFLFIPLIRKRKINELNIFFFILFISSCSVLSFAYYPHYFQLVIPYLLLLIISLPQLQEKKHQMIFLLLFLMFLKGFYSRFKITHEYKKVAYTRQKVNVKILDNYLNKGDKVYLQAISPAYYFLCKYDSPNFGDLGYKFPIELTLKRINLGLPKGSFIIVEPELKKNKEFKNYVVFKELSLYEKDVVILKKIENAERH